MIARTALPRARGLAALGLLAAGATALVGCGDGSAEQTPPPPGGRRSEIVAAAPGASADGKKPTGSPGAHASATAKPARVLCDKPPAGDGQPLPTEALAKVEEGAPILPDVLPTGDGSWTWVNLWAGWCGPCKEEMPMLAAWHLKLREAGTPVRFTFVSLDDDEREARRFLAGQPAVKQSYRLVEGDGRRKWLAALSLPETPQLPVHLLFDRQGKLRCVVTGAVHEADFARVKELVAK